MPRKRFARQLLSFLRARLRFSLRTLLIVTLAAALAVKWWMTPGPTIYALPDGATLSYSLLRSTDPATKAALEPRRHGRYELRGKDGRLLVRGNYENGLPSGSWRVFHRNRRKAIQGTTVSGERSGQWTAWSEAGDLISRANFQVPDTKRPLSAGKFTAPWSAKRAGSADTTDELGHHRGSFVNDLREGEWLTTDVHGKVIRRSEFHWGVRHGKTIDIGPSGVPRETYYRFGHALPATAELLAQLERDLDSNNGGRQYEAVRIIVALGAPTEPLLHKILGGNNASLQMFALRFLAQHRVASQEVLSSVDRLRLFASPSVAIEAGFALYQLVPDRRLHLAIQLLQFAGRSELPVRYRIALQLGQQPGPVTDALISQLDSDDSATRRVVMETLAVMLCADTAHTALAQRISNVDRVLSKARGHRDPAISEAAKRLHEELLIRSHYASSS